MHIRSLVFLTVLAVVTLFDTAIANVQLGPRPLYLVNSMDEGTLKEQLKNCAVNTSEPSKFSIGHRGAPLQFPEHTRESYVAAASMGAGILECDVTFTKDRELVCRHSQCDLHQTTNILAVPELAKKCSIPFTPAKINNTNGALLEPASAQCCTSDITVDEFLSLKGKMDAANLSAQTVEEYLDGTANYRTDLYSEQGTLMTHAQSIDLFKSLNVGMTPELKEALVPMPFDGDYTQEQYAQQLVSEYESAGIAHEDVWMQSFNLQDVLYWIEQAPKWGNQAVYLDGRYRQAGFDPTDEGSWKPAMAELKQRGVNIIAPPLWFLLQESEQGGIAPGVYATRANEAGLDIITWTLERSGFLDTGGDWYYQSVKDVINNDGDMYTVLDVLAKEVGVIGVFSDWPATVTYYANCMKLP